MEENKLPVITISREYYAGGRSIAEKLSKLLDIPWYDNDLAKLASEAAGYSKEDVLNSGEEISRLENAIEKLLGDANFYTSAHDEIYKAQKQIILDLAQSPCIIVGRSANAMLKEAGIPSFDIFLYADLMIRIDRIKQVRSVSEQEARRYLNKHDSFRSLYYNKYTGKTYGDPHEYSICLNTGDITYDQCALFLAAMLKNYDVWNMEREALGAYTHPFGKEVEK